jgi:hypothetical protein
MRIVVRDILAGKTPQPPAEYLALEVSRPNEAITVADDTIAGGNPNGRSGARDRRPRVGWKWRRNVLKRLDSRMEVADAPGAQTLYRIWFRPFASIQMQRL